MTLLQVWGTQSEGAKHNPPTDIVWRSLKTWGAGDKTTTKLLNTSGEVSSRHTLIFRQSRDTAIAFSQVVATFSQRKETTPAKPSTSYPSLESSSVRSFPRIPEEMERDVASSSRVPLERQQLQQVGDEHVFHQQVQKGTPSGREGRSRVPRSLW